jgi:aerobic-type carbon monoxide dehydrogenase small subunit (CoxS/CutS family)
MAKFFVNCVQVDFNAAPDTPLLWALRDQLGLTGTKFGCGMALCGACTVHVDQQPVRSCVTPVSSIEGKRVVTIEGISETSQGPTARAVKAALMGVGDMDAESASEAMRDKRFVVHLNADPRVYAARISAGTY